jgi:hypothetical protein
MDVYLVPVGPERYELYCESADEPPVPQAASSSGWRRWNEFRLRLQEWFSRMLAALEREYERERTRMKAHRHRRDGFLRRLRARCVRWLAERVADQRLLWRLRGQLHVRALHPTELDGASALKVIRRNLAHDADQHSRWLVLDGVGMLLSGVLVPFPGRNLPGYYFTFRVVGHFLAMRGARQGLRKVEWEPQPSPPLSALAGLGRVPPDERMERVCGIERELGLTKLARFFERIVIEPA